MKLAFLFGAGASKGAGAVLPHPPPLGAELYECLRSAFPRTWGTLHSELDGLFRENFELGMDAAWNQQIEDGAWLLIDMARYFARFDAATDGSDLYSRFTKLLTTSRIVDRAAAATLNYECVLEIAASNGGLRIAYLAEEPPPGNLLVWKPHGSCNFLPTSQVFNLTLIAKNFYEGRLRFLSPPEVITLYEQGYALPPAMSLFAPGKPTPVAPSFVSEVRRQWATWVKQSDFIVVIGTRPIVSDPHIWEPIFESDGQVWYIGSLADFETLAAEVDERAEHFAERFEDGFTKVETRLRILGR